nr:transposase [Azospirillum sp. B4]
MTRLRRGCERHRVGYVFGLAGNKVLLRRVVPVGDKVRRRTEFPYAAKSWKTERRVIARIDASPRAWTAASSSPI